jgi:hypothetical protein
MFDVRSGDNSLGPSILKSGSRQLDELGEVGVLVPDEYVGKEVSLIVHPPNALQDIRARLTALVEG